MRFTGVALSLLAVACATASPEAAAIRAATKHYTELTVAMDHAGIGAMFAPDGELVVSPTESIRGPEAIDKYLQGFASFHVLSDVLTTDRVDVRGAAAHSVGTYEQRVTLPNGQTVTVHGGYAADWVRGANGAWLIRRLSTTPAQG